jgi:hypothetical protein
MERTNHVTDTETADSVWKPLYQLAGAAALLAAVIAVIHITVVIIWPPPFGGTATDWFTLFHNSALLGLVSLDLPFVVVGALMVPIMLALCVALWRVSPPYVALATAIFTVGITGLFASNPSVQMLSLSNQYIAAATDAERAVLLGAGEAMSATFQGTAFHVNYILGQLAGIIIGAVMLRTTIFSKSIAYLMIVGNAVGFGLYLPVVGIALSAFSGVILLVWFIVLARRFFQLGRDSATHQAPLETRRGPASATS